MTKNKAALLLADMLAFPQGNKECAMVFWEYIVFILNAFDVDLRL
jgi:hypothetical protein